MKKILLIYSIYFLTINLYFKEDTKLVFNEEYAHYILSFPNQNISTNNINMFNNLDIVWIEPYINVLYSNKLKYRYEFIYMSLDSNIDRFKINFINKISKYSKKDAINMNIEGIKIKKMLVYSKLEDIKKLNINDIKMYKINNSAQYNSVNS